MRERPVARQRDHDNEALIPDLPHRAGAPQSAYDLAGQATARGVRVVATRIYRRLARLIPARAGRAG